MMKTALKLLVMFCMAIGLMACDKKTTEQQPTNVTSLKVTVATTEISAAILQPSLGWLKQQGLDVELVIMAGNVNVIRAVEDGSVDAGLGVHIKFMDSFNQQNNGHLAMVEPYAFTTGIGLYSEKYQSIKELPDGAKIAIMNDAMNMDRGLRMLRDAGLFELKKESKGGYSLIDIDSNPKHIVLVDMNQVQTVRALSDMDAAVVFFTHMKNAGKDFKQYIIRDTDAKDFPMGIVVQQKNVQTPWAKLLAEALLQKSVRENIEQKFGGVFEYYQ